MSRKRILALAAIVLIILFIIPLVFNDRGHTSFQAPGLQEIDYEEVFFRNESSDLNLAGMLMVPEAEGSFPTVVIIQGSGPSFRNNGWYLSIVKHLQENGVAVLIPDKRGSEKSEGEWIGADFHELAGDVLSAFAFIQEQDRFESSYVGIVGMSQGGWIAPVVATMSKSVSFIASLSGASVTAYEQLLHEETNNIAAYTYPFIAKLIAPITTRRLQKKEYLKAYASFDPIPYLVDLEIPVFYAFGQGDKYVPVDPSIERLKENGLNHFQVKTYPNGGHAILDIESNSVSKECLNDLVSFIKGI